MTENRFKADKYNFEIWDNGDFLLSFDQTIDLLNSLNDENEQLKQFKKKVFALIDKEITQNEEAIEWGEEIGANYGAIGFYNNMLNRLKKELQE